MSLSVTNYFGSITGLEAVSSDEGLSRTSGEVKDKCGSTVKAFGIETQGKPSNSYRVTDTVTWGDIALGAEVSGVVVTQVVIATTAGEAPDVQISGEDIGTATPVTGLTEASITDTPTDDTCAQALEGAPDTVAGCHLQSCTATYTCDLKRIPGGDGTTKKYSISNPRVEVTATYQSTDATEPTDPVETDTLIVTQPASKSDDNTTLPKFTLSFTKFL